MSAEDAAAACVNAYREWRDGGVIAVDRDRIDPGNLRLLLFLHNVTSR